MAGARTTGHVAARTVVVSKSSAMPAASLAMNEAVAGATTINSADFEIAMCLTWSTSVKRSGSTIETGFPDSASKVVFPMNLNAFWVATT